MSWQAKAGTDLAKLPGFRFGSLLAADEEDPVLFLVGVVALPHVAREEHQVQRAREAGWTCA